MKLPYRPGRRNARKGIIANGPLWRNWHVSCACHGCFSRVSTLHRPHGWNSRGTPNLV